MTPHDMENTLRLLAQDCPRIFGFCRSGGAYLPVGPGLTFSGAHGEIMKTKRSSLSRQFMRGILAAGALLTGSLGSVAACAADETGQSDAKILSMAGLVNLDDLAFGSLIPGASGGSVTINPANGARATTGSVVGAASTYHPARFRANGSPNVLALIALPTSATITNQNGPGTMTVNNFNVDGAAQILFVGLAVNLGPTGVRDLDFGARLNVGANQEPGSYEGTFNVTVIYL